MAARLLAYGGTSFSERRRIGTWPAVPEATLRDTYGLSSTSWCFGCCALDSRPFIILRQRQNIESRGGYPYSLLLDPGDEIWRRFDHNGASLVEALLRDPSAPLFQTPESCSAETLERTIAALDFQRPTPAPSHLALAIVASARDAVLLGGTDRPSAAAMAEALAAVPREFRTGPGWLIGGGAAHGKALGARLVFDDQAQPDWPTITARGRQIQDAWNAALQQDITPTLAPGTLDALLLLHQIQTASQATDDLLHHAANAIALRSEIDAAVADLLTRGTGPIPAQASALLLTQALDGKRKLDSATVSRLHEPTLRVELRRFGAPPKKLPKTLAIAAPLRLSLWLDHLESNPPNLAMSLAEAINQLPDQREALEAAARRVEAENAPPPPPPPPPKPQAPPDLEEAVRKTLFDSTPDTCAERAARLRGLYEDSVTAKIREALDASVLPAEPAPFVAAFSTQYSALGDAFFFLSERAQDHLLQFLPTAGAALDINHALKNRHSRNAYTRALGRLLLRDRALLKQTAKDLGDLPEEIESKIQRMLKDSRP